jgi:MerR family transcriptional regulator, thiopeptide resistance regulator
MKPAEAHETAAAFAARFGVSIKALRVYEKAGLLRPKRTAADWRVYDQPCAERLTTVLALKGLGLPLAKIKALLVGRGGDLSAVLDMQAQALEIERRRIAQALGLVRAARDTLAAGGRLTVDDLATLSRRTTMQKFEWTPELEAIAQKTYAPGTLADLRKTPISDEENARVGAAWSQLFVEMEALGLDKATTPQGLAIARRAHGLIREFTQGDAARWNGAANFWSAVKDDPTASAQTGYNSAHWAFLAKAFKLLQERGELTP